MKDLGKLSGMTTWSCNVLMDHRKEVRRYKHSKVEDARLDKWSSSLNMFWDVRALRVPSRFQTDARKCGLMPKDDLMWFLTRKRESKGFHKARTKCCRAYCGAPSEPA